MEQFNEYSKYYDLFYKEKDYNEEAAYIDRLICQLEQKPCNLLDIGCGTGKHANILVDKGYKVHGIDKSETMLQEAINNFGDRVTFSKGDIRDFKLNKTFSVITSLFHVMSYQTANNELDDCFQSIYNHLEDNGYFIFDCWYGPGVMNDLPTIRIKRITNNNLEILRLSEPEINYNDSFVNINFEIIVTDLMTNSIKKLYEKHNVHK